jgi:hypothetical protein
MEENENLTNLPLQSGGRHGNKSNVNFYNPIGLKGEKLVKAKRKVKSQAEKILDFFEKYPYFKFTSCEIRKSLIESGELSPITQEATVRARLTDLQKNGCVVKLNELRLGFYGMPNHLWQYVEPLEVVVNPVPLQPVGTQAEIFI